MSCRLALVSAMALLTACSATPTFSGEPASGRPDPSGAIGCPAVNLLAPDGSAVDLSGIWRSDDLGAYYIHQDQSCVAWLGVSDYPGRELGQDWANVFTGLIASDFSISGTWSGIDYPNPRPFGSAYNPDAGQILLQIQFDQNLRPVLTLPVPTESYLGHVWVLDATLPAIVEIEGLLGGSADGSCAWVESAGIRYVLLTGDRLGDARADWTLEPGVDEVQLRDRRGLVGARTGDSIRVRGQPFPVEYGGCAAGAGQGWAGLLVETMTPNP